MRELEESKALSWNVEKRAGNHLRMPCDSNVPMPGTAFLGSSGEAYLSILTVPDFLKLLKVLQCSWLSSARLIGAKKIQNYKRLQSILLIKNRYLKVVILPV